MVFEDALSDSSGRVCTGVIDDGTVTTMTVKEAQSCGVAPGLSSPQKQLRHF